MSVIRLTANASGLGMGWVNRRCYYRFPSTLDLANCGKRPEMGTVRLGCSAKEGKSSCSGAVRTLQGKPMRFMIYES